MITIDYGNGYVMTYRHHGGHNVRLEGHGVAITTGEQSLQSAIVWGRRQIRSIGKLAGL